MTTVAIPEGSNTVNPFILADRAEDLIVFLTAVLNAQEVAEARTFDTDGLILHSELKIGNSLLMIADRKPDWPFTPAFTRIYVDDVDTVLKRAEANGGRIITKATDFFGDVLGRFQDPTGNLWWIFQHNPAADYDWTATESAEADGDQPADVSGGEDWESFSTPELEYIHSTLVDAMRTLRDPRDS